MPAPVVTAVPAAPVVAPNASVAIASPVVPKANVPNAPDDDKDKDKDKGKEPPKPVPPNRRPNSAPHACGWKPRSMTTASTGRAAQAESEAAYQAGLRLFNNFEYEKAMTMFERALQKDPLNELAHEKLRQVKSLLNIGTGMGAMIRGLAQEERLKVQGAGHHDRQ